MLQKTKNHMDRKSSTVDRLRTQSSIIKFGTTDDKVKSIIERDEAIIKRETDVAVKERQLQAAKEELVASKLEIIGLKQ